MKPDDRSFDAQALCDAVGDEHVSVDEVGLTDQQRHIAMELYFDTISGLVKRLTCGCQRPTCSAPFPKGLTVAEFRFAMTVHGNSAAEIIATLKAPK